jgi:glucose-1-phosphatase
MAPVGALLFDLGNVVIHIDFDDALAAWQRHASQTLETLRELYRFDDAYHRHETGALDAAGYFSHVRTALGLECSHDEVAAGWNRVLQAPVPETVALIAAVKDRVPCYALSNTNETHLRRMQAEFAQVLALFRRVFVSHEIGHRKPSAEAFRHVVDAIGVPAGQVLFFDDLPENVEAARAFGLQAALVRAPADVRDALAGRGLVAQ